MESKYFSDEVTHFNSIHSEHYKYNLSWAFEDAQDKVNGTFDKIKGNELPITCSLLKEALSQSTILSNLKKRVFKYEKRAKWLSRLFKHTHHILTVFEILLSVLLVIAMSNLSHMSESFIESESLSIMIVVVFAFLKVFVERLFLQPQIESFGWHLYKRSYTGLFSMLDQALDTDAKDYYEQYELSDELLVA